MAISLLEIGLMFGGIAIASTFAKYIKKSVIPFYIIVGILLSQFVLGKFNTFYIGSSHGVDAFITISAELGIILLLFFLGLEFSIDRLIESKSKIGKAGIIDLINLVVGIGIGLVLFNSLIPALLLGGIVYMSSSAIITKSLVDLGWIANDESEPILGVLVFEDIFIALYLVVLSILLTSGELNNSTQIATTVVILTGFFMTLVLLVNFGQSIFQKILATNYQELFVIRIMAIVIIVGGIALSLGISEAVAAFFIGMGFARTTHIEQLENLLTPVKDIFAAVFFFWIGLQTNPLAIFNVLGVLLLLVTITTIVKFLSGYLAGKVYQLNRRKSIKTGLGLIPRGEFSLIIATLAVTTTGVYATTTVTEIIPSLAVGYVFFTSILGTVGMQYSQVFEKLRLPNIKFNQVE